MSIKKVTVEIQKEKTFCDVCAKEIRAVHMINHFRNHFEGFSDDKQYHAHSHCVIKLIKDNI